MIEAYNPGRLWDLTEVGTHPTDAHLIMIAGDRIALTHQ